MSIQSLRAGNFEPWGPGSWPSCLHWIQSFWCRGQAPWSWRIFIRQIRNSNISKHKSLVLNRPTTLLFGLLNDKSWLTPADAECDRQATVVDRLLTALGDDRHAVAKLFSVQRLCKSSRWITLMFNYQLSRPRYRPTSSYTFLRARRCAIAVCAACYGRVCMSIRHKLVLYQNGWKDRARFLEATLSYIILKL